MVHVVKGTVAAQKKHSSDIEQCLDSCKEKFNQILFGVINAGNQDAHKMEASIFKQLMKLGFILMQLFFASQNKGNYGKTIETAKGIAKRGRTSVRSYFFNFWQDESDSLSLSYIRCKFCSFKTGAPLCTVTQKGYDRIC